MNELEKAKRALEIALIEVAALFSNQNEGIDNVPDEILKDLIQVLQLELDSRQLRIYN
mgnify:FL=1|jgi:hypothetical protein|tara:strand:+ start:283 stop:456 length:174 start_codon:yes stop_codon:yes gene_type:complete